METPKTYEQGIHYNDLHDDHKNWIAELEFNKEEIHFFQKLLEKSAADLVQKGKAALVEQFQNRFILKLEKIDIYQHEIRAAENKLTEFIKTHQNNIAFITFSDHKKWKDQMATHRKIYAELKQEFFNVVR